ncbi:hypothetical protein KC19_5G113200 [Ceratodon purpureus]|uniref:Retrovirus-related Pol polyprotein from transposon TNT 1-94 n=1 Tax=Ceratodon purpureus TaxID=3225 RepID=A0A8T0I2G3_CERPU|nr:hypothetical protein KC19_5G113200 [Ceratodon purpureus]
MFTMAGGPISWSSKRQPTVSRSSTESKYRALSDSTEEGVWLRRMLLELGFLPNIAIPVSCVDPHILVALPSSPIDISCDNQGAIKLARNPVFHARTKHIELHHHFVRERVVEGEISLHYIPTSQQPADILTKPLGRNNFEFYRKTIGITEFSTLHPASSQTGR